MLVNMTITQTREWTIMIEDDELGALDRILERHQVEGMTFTERLDRAHRYDPQEVHAEIINRFQAEPDEESYTLDSWDWEGTEDDDGNDDGEETLDSYVRSLRVSA